MEDNLLSEDDVKEYQIRSYDDLSLEFQRLYPRVIRLIPLIYNRLTLVDKLSHKEAIAKIYNDHRDLSGFSRRNIRRNLPLDNATVPRRIRPSWPKNSIIESNEAPGLSVTIHEQNQNVQTSNNSKETTTNLLEESLTEIEMTGYNISSDHSDNTKVKEISLLEIEFTIPKEKYPNLEDAMQKSRDSVYLVFDKSGMLERAIPDIFRGELSTLDAYIA